MTREENFLLQLRTCASIQQLLHKFMVYVLMYYKLLKVLKKRKIIQPLWIPTWESAQTSLYHSKHDSKTVFLFQLKCSVQICPCWVFCKYVHTPPVELSWCQVRMPRWPQLMPHRSSQTTQISLCCIAPQFFWEFQWPLGLCGWKQQKWQCASFYWMPYSFTHCGWDLSTFHGVYCAYFKMFSSVSKAAVLIDRWEHCGVMPLDLHCILPLSIQSSLTKGPFKVWWGGMGCDQALLWVLLHYLLRKVYLHVTATNCLGLLTSHLTCCWLKCIQCRELWIPAYL